MKILNRGLYALILIILFQSQLLAEYLYKDEVVKREAFAYEVEKLGAELYDKTGIALRLLMLKDLPENKDVFAYEKEVLENFSEPTILLTFVEYSSDIDIQVNDPTLYKYFNRKQVLSPVVSPIQAFVVALVYAHDWESFDALRTDYGGTILPLIAEKTKSEQVIGKYAGSMFNGYIDIAQQIAAAKNVVLQNDPGDSNQDAIFYVKLVFYGFIIYGIVMYIRRVIYRRRHKNENR